MASGLNLPSGEVELTFGNTFTKNFKDESFHTIRYDFKPASVDTKKKGTVIVHDKNNINVTVPHVDSSGTTETVFKGSKMSAAKECLLIVDHNTGKITLERISQRIRVKKYRPDRKSSPFQGYSPSHNLPRGGGGGHPSSSPSLPSRPSPPHTSKNSPSHKNSNISQQKSQSATSMPMLGFDEEPKQTELMSDSSSDSDSNSGSSSSSDSDSDSEPEERVNNNQGAMNGGTVTKASPSVFDDLQLSDDED